MGNWDQTSVKLAIANREISTIEFKQRQFLQSRTEIAIQLTSFANKNGGGIFIGVTDDGQLEGVRFTSKEVDQSVLKLSSISKDKCSPPVEFAHQLVSCPEGDILIIDVERRKGYPSAIVQRENHEIIDRTYYIRTTNGNRLVDDETLGLLFSQSSDFILDYRFTTWIQYYRDSVRPFIPSDISPEGETPSIPSFVDLERLLKPLRPADVERLKQNEENNMTSVLTELLPCAILLSLQAVFDEYWLVQIEERPDMGLWSIKPSPLEIGVGYEILSGDSLRIVPDSSFLSRLSLDFNDILATGRLVVPPSTNLALEYENDNNATQRSILRMICPGCFAFQLTFDLVDWFGGTAPGMPWDDIYHSLARRGAITAKQLRDSIASVSFDSRFVAKYDFSAEPSSTFEHYRAYAESIKAVLNKWWDWQVYLKALANTRLLSIDRRTKRILDILERKAYRSRRG